MKVVNVLEALGLVESAKNLLDGVGVQNTKYLNIVYHLVSSKRDMEHKSYCAKMIAINNQTPFTVRCDCKKKPKIKGKVGRRMKINERMFMQTLFNPLIK